MFFSKFFIGISKWWKLLLVAIIISLAWLYLWYFPWQSNLHHIYWLQLGVGLTIFIIPGLCLYGLLSDRSNFGFRHVTFGFVFSHLIFALLGTVGRFIHLSFEVIGFLMMILGLILLLSYIIPRVDRGIIFRLDRERSIHILAILPVLLVSLLACLIVIQRVLSDDDLTYLAFLTKWQHSTHLDFNDVIFGESQLTQPRFWLMSAPIAQALLAELSQMPGILILGGYYEPFLVFLSVLCWYELAIALKLSPIASSASVILQLTFLLLQSEYLHPGAPYFNQLSTDKATAAFIFVPVFFYSLIKLLEDSTRNNKILLLLTGLSLMLMHPVILAYAVFIGGLLVLLSKENPGVRSKLMLITLLVILLIPQIIFRFVRMPTIEPASYDPEVVLNQSGSDSLTTRWGDTQFYGFNLNILDMKIPYETNIPPLFEPILSWGWLLIPMLTIVVILKHRNNYAAQFILSCFALCFLTGFPLTGWIFGYFLSGRMLARSIWLFPFGISAVYLLITIRNKLWTRLDEKTTRLLSPNRFILILTVFTVSLFLLFFRENKLPNMEKFLLKSIRYQGLSTAGQALDHLTSNDVITIGSPAINDLIPGISSKSKLITFRIQNPSNMPYFTSTERGIRISDMQQLFSPSTSIEARISLLRKYNVRFLLLQRGDLKIFSDLIAGDPDQFTATEIGGVYLVQIH